MDITQLDTVAARLVSETVIRNDENDKKIKKQLNFRRYRAIVPVFKLLRIIDAADQVDQIVRANGDNFAGLVKSRRPGNSQTFDVRTYVSDRLELADSSSGSPLFVRAERVTVRKHSPVKTKNFSPKEKLESVHLNVFTETKQGEILKVSSRFDTGVVGITAIMGLLEQPESVHHTVLEDHALNGNLIAANSIREIIGLLAINPTGTPTNN